MYLNKTIILLLSVVILSWLQARDFRTKPKIKSNRKQKVNITGNFTIGGAYALYPLVQEVE